MAAPALSLAHRAGIYGLLAVVLIASALLVPGFATATNLANVVTQTSALGLVAIGQTFVIAAGLIDLSVGQLLGLSVVLTCALSEGRAELLVPVLAAHVDVDALDTWGVAAEQQAEVEIAAAESIKRIARKPRGITDAAFDWTDDRAAQRPEWIAAFLEMKTVWHPIGA